MAHLREWWEEKSGEGGRAGTVGMPAASQRAHAIRGELDLEGVVAGPGAVPPAPPPQRGRKRSESERRAGPAASAAGRARQSRWPRRPSASQHLGNGRLSSGSARPAAAETTAKA